MFNGKRRFSEGGKVNRNSSISNKDDSTFNKIATSISDAIFPTSPKVKINNNINHNHRNIKKVEFYIGDKKDKGGCESEQIKSMEENNLPSSSSFISNIFDKASKLFKKEEDYDEYFEDYKKKHSEIFEQKKKEEYGKKIENIERKVSKISQDVEKILEATHDQKELLEKIESRNKKKKSNFVIKALCCGGKKQHIV